MAEWRAYFRLEAEKHEKDNKKKDEPQVYGVDKQGAAMLKAAFAHKVVKKAS